MVTSRDRGIMNNLYKTEQQMILFKVLILVENKAIKMWNCVRFIYDIQYITVLYHLSA